MGGVRGRQFETSLVIFDLTWSALPSKQRLFRGRGHLVDGNIFPPIPLIPHLAAAGVSVRGMWGMRGMFLVFARRRHVDSVGIRIVFPSAWERTLSSRVKGVQRLARRHEEPTTLVTAFEDHEVARTGRSERPGQAFPGP